MRLSVIIPIYMVETTLKRCLKSVVEQDYEDMEIILVNDGTHDDSMVIANNFAQKDQRIRIINKENGGLSSARNSGLEIATGDYITFVDSDDYISEHTYSQLMDIVSKDNTIDILEYPVYMHYGSDEQRILSFPDKEYVDSLSYFLDAQAYQHAYAWNKIYACHIFKDIRYPEGMVFEDTITLPLLMKAASIIRTTDKGLYYYCSNPHGITKKAGAEEMKILLRGNIEYINRLFSDKEVHQKIMDSKHFRKRFLEFYSHVLNIQLTVYKMSKEILLPEIDIKDKVRELDIPMTNKIKLKLLSKIGIEKLCKIHNAICH